MKYIELDKTSNNNNDMDEILIKEIEQLLKKIEQLLKEIELLLKEIEQLLKEIEQLTIHGPSKESVTKYREKMRTFTLSFDNDTNI